MLRDKALNARGQKCYLGRKSKERILLCCTSEVKPLDSGIIQNVQHLYRTKIVQKLVTMLDLGLHDVSGKKIGIFRAMNFVAASWIAIKPSTIANCFAEAGFNFQPGVPDVVHDGDDADVVNLYDVVRNDCTLK